MKALKRSKTSSSSDSSSPSSSISWIHLRSILFVVASSSPVSCSYPDRGHLKSPWSHRKRKRALSLRRWRSFFTPDGRLRDGGVKFLKKVRSGGVEPSIRAEVWPFLLGVFDLNSSKEERDSIRCQKRKEYARLRLQCRRLLKCKDKMFKLNGTSRTSNGNNGSLIGVVDSPVSEDVSCRESVCSGERSPYNEYSDNPVDSLFYGNAGSRRITELGFNSDSESSDSDSSADPVTIQNIPSMDSMEKNTTEMPSKGSSSPSMEAQSTLLNVEDFATWRRIIRLDAIRANGEWMAYSPGQAAVSELKAHQSAEAVGLKDYNHLDPCRIVHAARLVAILEAYALYDPEIGYCQGMSDLLSPIISVITDDYEAFWCFVGFMKKARHNFRLDEVGIRRQLNVVSKIIKHKDSHLYRHLEKLEAEDCFFVYRMVVVLFRRELTFDQTIILWEVMWADQAAIRARIGKSGWSKIRLRAPPTEDLLLYAIAASVLQRKKQIIEKHSSMEEILRECNNMAGNLDVWKLLGDAHDLVVTLHDKV